jgi:hypothetical protein
MRAERLMAPFARWGRAGCGAGGAPSGAAAAYSRVPVLAPGRRRSRRVPRARSGDDRARPDDPRDAPAGRTAASAAGPSRVPDERGRRRARPGARIGRVLLGTSHRPGAGARPGPGAPLRASRTSSGPEGYEVLLTVGGATAFWDAAVFGIIERARSTTSSASSARSSRPRPRAAAVARGARRRRAEPGTRPTPVAAPADVDVHAWTHNETSTGVMQDIRSSR